LHEESAACETWTVADELYSDLLIGAGAVMIKEKNETGNTWDKKEDKMPLSHSYGASSKLCFVFLFSFLFFFCKEAFSQSKILKPMRKYLRATF